MIAICSKFCSPEGVNASKKLNDQLRVPSLLNYQQKEVVLKSFISGHFSYCLLIWIFSSVNSYEKINISFVRRFYDYVKTIVPQTMTNFAQTRLSKHS